jgi:hypothetical protein
MSVCSAGCARTPRYLDPTQLDYGQVGHLHPCSEDECNASDSRLGSTWQASSRPARAAARPGLPVAAQVPQR